MKWQEEPCRECRAAVLCRNGPVTCPDCREEFYENLAVALDPSYDRTKMNDFVDLWKIVGRLWCFPQAETTLRAVNITEERYRETGTYRKIKVDGVKVDEWGTRPVPTDFWGLPGR